MLRGSILMCGKKVAQLLFSLPLSRLQFKMFWEFWYKYREQVNIIFLHSEKLQGFLGVSIVCWNSECHRDREFCSQLSSPAAVDAEG